MMNKIQPHHLERKAVLYVRQSSAHQVTHNTESRHLQYAMTNRLRQLGWRDIDVIDEDLGQSAAGAVRRLGFERMVAEVCLGHVGAVAAREVSRFARNSRDWQRLIEVCRVVDTVLIDQDTIYAPRQSADRLLLGVQGSVNEYELDLLRQRAVAARLEKARRGELVVGVPVGYIKTADQRVEKDPDRRVQEVIHLVFRKFFQLGSVRQTLMWFIEHDVALPVRSIQGDLAWKRPRYTSVYNMLTHPAYGGAYVYGRTEAIWHYEGENPRRGIRRKPREQWLTLIPNAHEGYISWDQYNQMQQLISANARGDGQPGAAREGRAVLASLLRCRRCGRKLLVAYTGRDHDVLRYVCVRGYLDNGLAHCLAFGGLAVDKAVCAEVLRVVEPGALEAAVMACDEAARQQDEVLAVLQRDLEAARYEAHRAWKQYDANDPENRLVTSELERRWNQALERVQGLEKRIEAHQNRHPQHAVATVEDFEGLAADLEALWHHPQTDSRLKKRIVRALIHEVVVDVDAEAGEIHLVIHWKGGVHTELRLPRRRRGYSGMHTAPNIVEAVRVLVRTCSDDVIAGVLNRNGLLTGRGNRWTRERVTSLRQKRGIAAHRPVSQQAEGWMNLTQAASFLGISARTLRLAVERGEIDGEHPFAEGPWIFNRQALETDQAIQVVERAQRRRKRAAVPTVQSHDLDISST